MTTGDRPLDPRAPRRILDRYLLQERVAFGGTAEVWRAVDERLGRDVAVKLLHPHLLADEGARSRVEAEARAAARLAHPGIADVYDVTFTDGAAAIVMELVHGEALSTVLTRRGPLAPDEAAGIAAQIADALAHAHERGIVHRDVKPGNVLLARDGRARIVDFGIARELEQHARRLTASGTVVGTLRYMAPEQLAGAPGDGRTDVFGLGATLYEMLAGRPPFDAHAPLALAEQQRHPVSPIPGTPEGLWRIVAACLAADPSQRYPSAAILAADLRRWLAREGDSATQPVPRPAVAPPPFPMSAPAVPMSAPTASPPSTYGPPPMHRPAPGPPVAQHTRRRRGRFAPVLGLLALVGVVALLVLAAPRLPGVAGPGGTRTRAPGTGGAAGAETRAFSAVEDARIVLRDDFRAGSGASDTLPVGAHEDVLYRSLLRFEPTWEGMRRVGRVELRLVTTRSVRVRRGDAPRVRIRRAEGRWEQGTSTELSARNAVTWANQPPSSAEGEIAFSSPRTAGATVTVDVTELYLPFLPESLGGEGAQDHGLVLLAASDDGSEADGEDTDEFWSSESDERGPELVVSFDE